MILSLANSAHSRLSVVLAFCTLIPAIGLAEEPAQPNRTPCHCRVVWHSNPLTTATIVWDTYKLGDQHQVTSREKGTTEERTTAAYKSDEYAFLRKEDAPYYFHYVLLDNLKPGTTYEIQLNSDDNKSRWFHFDTAMTELTPFSLLFGGDSRSGLAERKKVNQMICQMTTKSWESEDTADHIYALAHGGDYVVTGTNPTQWHQWLDDFELTTGKNGRLLPIIPARGNHDRGRLFAQVFGYDPVDTNYFGLSFGSMLRFVTLNTEVSIAGDQAKWLSEELAAARPQHRWLLAQYHRPAYPAVKAPSGALTHWVPLFDKHQVDVVCEADGHNIKRTLPIRGGTYDPAGVVYIGEGGLGVHQRTPKESRWFLRSPGMCDRGHHVHVLRFENDQLTIECCLLSGQIRDVYSRKPYAERRSDER